MSSAPAPRWTRRPLLLAACALAAAPLRAATGGRETLSPSVGSFSAVRIALPADARLVPSTSPTLRITAEPAVLRALQVRVVSDELRLGAGSFQSRSPIEIELGYVTLRRLTLETSGDTRLTGPDQGELQLVLGGAASVTASRLNLSRLVLDSSGAGDANLSGTAAQLQITLSGTGHCLARDLRAQTARVTLGGTGDAEVHVARALEVRLDGTGSVRYAGRPRLQRQGDGLGDVEALTP